MNERIAQIRKAAGLTQEKFAVRLGLTRNFLWMIEKGDRIPSDRTIGDICREFNVSEVWLRTGQGPMYNELSSDAEFALIMESIGQQDPTVVHILKAYWHLSDAEKAAVRKLVDNIVDEYKKNAPE